MTTRFKPQTFRTTGYVEPGMKVLHAKLDFSGTTAPTLAEGSRSFVSASRDSAGIYKLWLNEKFPSNFAIVKTSTTFTSPFATNSNVIDVKVLSKDLTAADPYVRLGFFSASLGTGNALTGTYIDPAANYASTDIELTVKGIATPDE
jgi:hypothetical protein